MRRYKKEEKRIVPVGAFLLITMVVILAITGGILVVLLRTNAVEESLKIDPVLKTLFVISDTAPDGSKEMLSTALFFYYPVLNRGALFDIPGNTGAIFSSLGRVDRIDAVYREKGIALYCDEIESLTAQQIPFVVVFDLASLAVLTDYLGGLKVFLPMPVDTVGTKGNRVLLPSGSVVLDGSKIASFLTYETEEEGQIDAQDRRQKVMVALLDAIYNRRSYFTDKKNFAYLQNLFDFNHSKNDLRYLLTELSKIDAEQIRPQSVVGTLQQVDNQYLLFPQHDGQLLKEVIRQSIMSLLLEQDSQYNRIYVLEIQNGTIRSGLAAQTASLLGIVGYQIHATVNADASDYEHTLIIDHIGNPVVAKNLGDFIRCTNIVEEEVKLPDDSEASLVDFTIILGRDFDGRYVR